MRPIFHARLVNGVCRCREPRQGGSAAAADAQALITRVRFDQQAERGSDHGGEFPPIAQMIQAATRRSPVRAPGYVGCGPVTMELAMQVTV